MSLPSIVFIGHICIDINRTPTSEIRTLGGAAFFSALAASKIKQSIGLVSRVGKDYDLTFLRSHILLDGVRVSEDKPTMCSIQIYHTLSDLSDRDIEHVWGVGPDVCPKDFPKSWYSSVRYVHVATMPPNQQKPFVDFVRARMPQATLSIDTDVCFLKEKKTRDLIGQSFSKADIIFVNKHEYEALKPWVDKSPTAIIKLDKEGARLLHLGKQCVQRSAPLVKVVSSTGAGDVFAGTFIAKKFLGEEEENCLADAIEAASMFVSTFHLEDFV